MSRYSFDDLVEVANANSTIFDCFPGTRRGRQLTPPDSSMVLHAMTILQTIFPKDYENVVYKWGYLALGKDNGFFGVCGDFFNRDDFNDLKKPFNVCSETQAARKSIGLSNNFIVIWNDPRKGADYGVIDTKTGKVLSCDRRNKNSFKEVSDSFIDYVFRELILHRRANEIVYDTTFHWPEYLQDRIADDMLTLKEELDESDKLFDRYEEMLKNA